MDIYKIVHKTNKTIDNNTENEKILGIYQNIKGVINKYNDYISNISNISNNLTKIKKININTNYNIIINENDNNINEYLIIYKYTKFK